MIEFALIILCTAAVKQYRSEYEPNPQKYITGVWLCWLGGIVLGIITGFITGSYTPSFIFVGIGYIAALLIAGKTADSWDVPLFCISNILFTGGLFLYNATQPVVGVIITLVGSAIFIILFIRLIKRSEDKSICPNCGILITKGVDSCKKCDTPRESFINERTVSLKMKIWCLIWFFSIEFFTMFMIGFALYDNERSLLLGGLAMLAAGLSFLLILLGKKIGFKLLVFVFILLFCFFQFLTINDLLNVRMLPSDFIGAEIFSLLASSVIPVITWLMLRKKWKIYD